MGLGPDVGVTSGNIQSSFILTVSLTPAATGATTSAEQTFTIPGLQVGDQVTVSFNGAVTVLVDIINARVTAANTLGITFANGTAGSLTFPSGTYQVEVNRPYPGLAMTVIQ